MQHGNGGVLFKKLFAIIYSVPEEEGEEEKVRSAPIFVSKPEPVTVEEGDWSRFCCRVTGHPRPRVMWIINGHTVVNVNFKILPAIC